MIRILYFASLRETLGRDTEALELPADARRVGDLLDTLRARGGVWSSALAEDATIMAAVNQTMAHLDTPVSDGDEVAFFPPVTGG